LALPQKVTKNSRQALIAPRILPAGALQHSDILYHALGHNGSGNFTRALIM